VRAFKANEHGFGNERQAVYFGNRLEEFVPELMMIPGTVLTIAARPEADHRPTSPNRS